MGGPLAESLEDVEAPGVSGTGFSGAEEVGFPCPRRVHPG